MKDSFITINNEKSFEFINNESIVLVDYFLFTECIFSSFKNINNIEHQFCNDFNRSKFKINSITEDNIEYFQDYFICKLYLNNDYIHFLSLCTQASLAYPLELFFNNINKNVLYNENNENNENNEDNNLKYVGEIKCNKINKQLIFNIIEKKNNIFIIIKKNLRVFYINDDGYDETLYYINIKINIPYLNQEKIIITYKTLKNK